MTVEQQASQQGDSTPDNSPKIMVESYEESGPGGGDDRAPDKDAVEDVVVENKEAERSPLMPEPEVVEGVVKNGGVNGSIGGGKGGEDKEVVYEMTTEQWQAPDGGYGWVIMICALVISLIVDGLGYTFGLLLGPLERAFDAPKSTVALVNSLQVGMYLMSGPIVSALTNRYGCRPMIIIGSLVAGLAYLASSFSQSILMLVVLYGFVGGIGFGLMYLPAIVSVSVYFEEKRALATGIAVCGSGIGMFVMAPLTEFLLDTFNWRWTIVLLAAFILNGMVFGALVRPLKGTESSSSNCDKDVTSWKGSTLESGIRRDSAVSYSRKVSETSSHGGSRKNMTLNINHATARHRTNSTTSGTSGKDHYSVCESPTTGIALMPLMEGVESITVEVLEEPVSSKRSRSTHAMKSSEDINRTNNLLLPPSPGTGANNFSSSPAMHHHYLSSTSSIFQRLQLSASHQTLDPATRNLRARTPLGLSLVSLAASSAHLGHGSIRSVTRVNSVDKQSTKVTSSCLKCFSPATQAILSEMLNFSILKNKRYWFVLMGNFFCMVGFYVPFVYIPERAIELGIDESKAAFLLSIIGIANTVGRVLVGLIVQCLRLDCSLVSAFALIMAGAVTALLPMCEEYAALAALSGMFGLCVAAFVTLCSVLLCDLMGVANLTNAFGYVILFRGVACTVGPPVAGAIIDSTGMFHPAFYLGGGMIALGGISHLLLYFLFFSPCAGKHKSVDRNEAVA